jgi:hypothetical protein
MTKPSAASDASDLPPGLSQPALRAFASKKLARLADFTRVTEAELLALHGVGPSAIKALRPALAARGLSFAPKARKAR